MSLPNSSERVVFNIELPDRPGSLENYPNLLELCNHIIENMEQFNHALRRFRDDLEPAHRLEIIEGLSHAVHETFDLSLRLQQHLGVLSDSDEEIHLQEPLINYIRAVLNNASRMDEHVLAAQEGLHPSRPHHR